MDVDKTSVARCTFRESTIAMYVQEDSSFNKLRNDIKSFFEETDMGSCVLRYCLIFKLKLMNNQSSIEYIINLYLKKVHSIDFIHQMLWSMFEHMKQVKERFLGQPSNLKATYNIFSLCNSLNPSMASTQSLNPHSSSSTMNLNPRNSPTSSSSSHPKEFEADAHEVPSGPNPISNR
ncbi:hypothetical protein LguiB_030799 [Lonicera macranthoides]